MATINGFHAERMLEIEGDTVVDARVEDTGGVRNLILITRGGEELNPLPLPPGPVGPPGGITSSPAGGDLSGNYPDPVIGDGKVTLAKIAAAIKDAAANVASLRTLGTGALQAAAGDHTHAGLLDSGWVNGTPTAGEAPFASASVNYLQTRKIGKTVHLRFSKTSTAARDLSGVTSDNFPNVNVFGINSIPAAHRPKDYSIIGMGRIRDAYAGIALRPDGSLAWYGGAGRNYPANSVMDGDLVYHTDSV